MAASAEPAGSAKAPTWLNVWLRPALQPRLVARTVFAELKSWSWGWASAPVTPKPARAGPTPRSRIDFASPLVTKPTARTLESTPATPRADRFIKRAPSVADAARDSTPPNNHAAANSTRRIRGTKGRIDRSDGSRARW